MPELNYMERMHRQFGSPIPYLVCRAGEALEQHTIEFVKGYRQDVTYKNRGAGKFTPIIPVSCVFCRNERTTLEEMGNHHGVWQGECWRMTSMRYQQNTTEWTPESAFAYIFGEPRSEPKPKRFRAGFLAAWYDLWIGAYVDRKNRRVYVMPVPCLGFWMDY